MTIKERGYTHWEGELKDGRFPWWPITRIGIKLTFKRKFFKFFYAFTLIPALVWLVGIYISERLFPRNPFKRAKNLKRKEKLMSIEPILSSSPQFKKQIFQYFYKEISSKKVYLVS